MKKKQKNRENQYNMIYIFHERGARIHYIVNIDGMNQIDDGKPVA